jgi:hypothetical protein
MITRLKSASDPILQRIFQNGILHVVTLHLGDLSVDSTPACGPGFNVLPSKLDTGHVQCVQFMHTGQDSRWIYIRLRIKYI